MTHHAGQPVASVLMPVCNAADTIRESVQSILSQSFKNFELIIVDDGSTDGTVDYLVTLRDARLHLLRLEQHHGIVAALNTGLQRARGEFIFRMDADDMAMPDRLQVQLEWMQRHPEVDVCGTFIRCFDDSGPRGLKEFPLGPDDIRAALIFESALAHPSVVFRAEALRRGGLSYPEGMDGVEDYALWATGKDCLCFANIPRPLVFYRLPATADSERRRLRREKARHVREQLVRQLGVTVATDELTLHHAIAEHRVWELATRIEQVAVWLERLRTANDASQVFPQQAFERALLRRFYLICKAATLNKWNVCVDAGAATAQLLSQLDGGLRLRLTLRRVWQRLKQRGRPERSHV